MRVLRQLSLCFLLCPLLASVIAHAQRPALTKDVEAKGRIPYMQTFTGDQSSVCFAERATQFCTLTFNAVPAGFRLVVEHVSAEFVATPFASSPSLPGHVYLDNGLTGTDHVRLQLPAPTVTVLNANVQFDRVSAPVSFYVEGGAKPVVQLRSPDIAAQGLSFSIALEKFEITIVGYLISTT